jgi:AcrR family transcriptional regulator
MKLEREQIVRAALRLLNDVGLEGLTLRRIATDLDVQAPALYWHFRNKQALLDEMATTVLRDHVDSNAVLGVTGSTWQEWAIGFANGLRAMLLEYRDGARMFSGTYLTDATMFASMEQNLRVLIDAGFSLELAAIANATIYSFVIGFTIEEQSVFPVPGQRAEQYDLKKREDRVDAAKFPHVHASGSLALGNFDIRFERGVRMVISGMEREREGEVLRSTGSGPAATG